MVQLSLFGDSVDDNIVRYPVHYCRGCQYYVYSCPYPFIKPEFEWHCRCGFLPSSRCISEVERNLKITLHYMKHTKLFFSGIFGSDWTVTLNFRECRLTIRQFVYYDGRLLGVHRYRSPRMDPVEISRVPSWTEQDFVNYYNSNFDSCYEY